MKNAVVLDVGSSKMVCLCGSRVGADGISVQGAGIRPYGGYRFGQWADVEQTKQAAMEAVEAAQRECNFRLREAAISVPAPFIRLMIGEAVIDIAGPSGKPKRITGADIDMLINESLPKEPPEECVLMHSTPLEFTVDGAQKRDVPLDLSAVRLTGRVSHVYVTKAFLTPIQAALSDMGMEVSACIAAPLSQALLLLPAAVRRRLAVVADVGYTHTDISLIEGEALLGVETIEMGGMHFANDLSVGLTVPLSVTEPLKRRYTFSLDYQDSVELLRTQEGTLQVERRFIQYIIEERARELCSMIYGCLQDMNVNLSLKPALHLTGGGVAMMRGSHEFFESMLGVRIIREAPWMPRMSSPNYTSVYGTLEFLLHAAEEGGPGRVEGVQAGRVRKKLLEFFTK